MSTQAAYTKLLDFLGRYGKPTGVDFPPAALDRHRARLFLASLRAEGIRLLGIELWRRTEVGYRMDGPKGWYAEAGDLQTDSASAVEFLESNGVGHDDLFVFQY